MNPPIVLFGAARSGSTLLHRTLTAHPHVAWLTRLCDYFPHTPAINRLYLQAVDWPLLGAALRRRIVPGEAYLFWETHAPGFRRPAGDLTAVDAPEPLRRRLQRLLAKHTTGRRSRLLIKVTGWPRIGFLQAILPQARCVHLVRDGRAVVNSTLQVAFWDGHSGPDTWRFGPLTPAQQAQYIAYDRNPAYLAALGWRKALEAANIALAGLPHCHQLTYEALCAAPVDTLRRLADECRLEWTPAFEQSIAAQPWRARNDRWPRELTPVQQQIVAEVAGDQLARWGYTG